jgi:hypothetical protein
MVSKSPEDDRNWLAVVASPKDVSGQPELPADQSGFREERLGSTISYHLNASVEYIIVNVGGFDMDAEVAVGTKCHGVQRCAVHRGHIKASEAS